MLRRAAPIAVGTRVGALVVVRETDGARPGAGRRYLCACDCGGERETSGAALARGDCTSCRRCYRKRNWALRKAAQPEDAILRGIIARCENPRVASFADYGGRGIRVSARWRHGEDGLTGVACFIADLGARPSSDHSVERIDVDGNYEPGNCRWATALEQSNNKRRTRRVTYRGEEMALADAIRAAGSVIHIEAAWIRIRSGWSVERALETPRLHRSHNAKPGTVDDRHKTGIGGPHPSGQLRRYA